MASSDLRPAAEASVDSLMRLTESLRTELLRRGEFLPAAWVAESAQDLAGSRIPGWFCLDQGVPVALAFYSVRGARGFGHVHLVPSGGAVEDARRLVERLAPSLPASVIRLDVGVTGLSTAQERGLAETLRNEAGASVVVRESMERALTEADSEAPTLPPDLRLLPARSVALDALTTLDVRAFAGSPDESLVADSFDEDRRVLAEIFDGLLGKFLHEASKVLVTPGGALVAALLTGEQSSRTAVYLDLIVDPSHRRRGYATYLARWGFRALWALGYQTVRLWVTETNAPARRLYADLKFEPRLQAMIFRWDRPSGP